MGRPRSVIFDTDPSPDDAVAFLAAIASPAELEVLAVTTVAGNVPVELTAKNALKALELAKHPETPVYAGAAWPLRRPLVTAEHVHGKTGFDGYDLPEPSTPLASGYAPDAIVELVMSRPARTVTLCCLAPLTNVALAFAREPRLTGHLEGVVLMGGSFSEGGNITPAAEFNVYADPEAADVVFRAAWDVTMVGLDLTHQALATPELQNRVRAIGGPISKFILDIWEFIAATHGGLLQIAYPAVHDACCVAAIIDPSVFTTEKADVRVEIAGRWTKGMTVCNFEKMGGMHHFGGTASEQVNFRHTVAMALDHPKFCNLIVDALERLTRQNA